MPRWSRIGGGCWHLALDGVLDISDSFIKRTWEGKLTSFNEGSFEEQ